MSTKHDTCLVCFLTVQGNKAANPKTLEDFKPAPTAEANLTWHSPFEIPAISLRINTYHRNQRHSILVKPPDITAHGTLLSRRHCCPRNTFAFAIKNLLQTTSSKNRHCGSTYSTAFNAQNKVANTSSIACSESKPPAGSKGVPQQTQKKLSTNKKNTIQARSKQTILQMTSSVQSKSFFPSLQQVHLMFYVIVGAYPTLSPTL